VATLVAVLTAARESGRGLRKSETGSDLTFSVPDSALAELVLSAITSKLWRIESIVQQWGNERLAKPRPRRRPARKSCRTEADLGFGHPDLHRGVRPAPAEGRGARVSVRPPSALSRVVP
jgi:hypothetical protein